MLRLVGAFRSIHPARLARALVPAVVVLTLASDSSLIRLDLEATGGLARPVDSVSASVVQAVPAPAMAVGSDVAGAGDEWHRGDRGSVGGSIPAGQLVYPGWVDADQALEAYLAAYPAPSPTPLPTPDLTPSVRLAPRAAAPLVSNGPRGQAVVAITIDDTMRPASVRADHDFFMEHRINVTWFPVGRTIAGSAGLWAQIADAGFPIANHTWNHVDAQTQTQPQIEWEINTQAAAVLQHTGRPGVPFFRPMGGSWNANVLRAAGMTGMTHVVLWDVTSGDTGRGTVEEVVANAMRAQNGSIILFHANEERSDIAIRKVVLALQAKGFTFVTLGQLLGVPGPVPFPTPPAPDPSATPSPTPPPPPLFIPVPPAAPTGPAPAPTPSPQPEP